MLYLLLASLLWALSFGLIKTQLAGLDPFLIAAGRLVLAALAFLPFVLRHRLPRRLIGRCLAVGSVQFGLMYVLYLASFAWLPAWKIAFFTIFTPLYVIGLNDLAARTFSRRNALAAVLAVAGAALVMRGDSLGGDWRGVLLLQGANLCFAWGQLRFGRLRAAAGGNDTGLLGWMYVGALAVTLAALGMRGGTGPSLLVWPSSAVAALVYLGLVPTALGFYLWNRGAARTAPGPLAAANNLKVPLAILMAWLVFGEDAPLGRAALGLALVGLGLALAHRDIRHSDSFQAAKSIAES